MPAAAVHDDDLTIRTRRRHVTPRSPGQAAYLQALASHGIVFGIGPAGTGKTYLAVAGGGLLPDARRGGPDHPVAAGGRGRRAPGLPARRPARKVDPYLRPLYDALFDMLPAEQVMKYLSSGEVEVAPLAFMRGRTLSNAFVILDEAQNTRPSK